MEKDGKMEFLKAFNKVQGLLEPVQKDSVNPHFKSRYASLTAVNQAVMPVLAENGFMIFQGGVDIVGKPYLRTSLSHVDGWGVNFDYPLTVDANPQHTAAQVTYARRYAISALLNLSLEDDDAESTVARTPVKEFANATESKGSGDVLKCSFTPKAYARKDGETGGKPWARFSVCFSGKNGDTWFATFDEKFADVLKQAADEKLQLAIEYKAGAKGNTIVKADLVLEEVEF